MTKGEFIVIQSDFMKLLNYCSENESRAKCVKLVVAELCLRARARVCMSWDEGGGVRGHSTFLPELLNILYSLLDNHKYTYSKYSLSSA